jgi:hypothetical protein
MAKSSSRIKYEATEAGKATIKRCEKAYRSKTKRITVVIPEQELYLYQALLQTSYQSDSTLSSLVLIAIKEYLLRQQATVEF